MSDEDQAVVEETTEVEEDEGAETTPTETVKIGEQEYTQEEITDLVKAGMSYRELKEEFPETDFKELHKGFTQARQELAELKKAKEAEQADPQDRERYKQIDQFLDDPYVEKKLSEKLAQKAREEIEDRQFQELLDKLEDELDGKDGRPKFNRREVLIYGKEHGIINPRVAYKDMHEKELEDWTVKNAISKKPKATYSERRSGVGSKLPTPKEPDSWAEARAAARAREQAYKQE